MAAPGLPKGVDTIVVGGGCMGTATAFHLARRGVSVLLVERGHLASGATGHSGAIIRQQYESRIGVRLARRSLVFFQGFAKETGSSCDFRTTGFLSGARERDVPALEDLLALLRSEGVRANRLDPKETRGLEPRLDGTDYEALIHDPEAGYADPIATAKGFASGASQNGTRVFEHTGVRKILRRGHRVTGVRLGGGGTVRAEKVVLAAGNWTSQLSGALGPSLPLRFVRGRVAILRRPPDFGPAPRIHFDFYHGTYSRPEEDKETLVGYMNAPTKDLRRPPLRDSTMSVEEIHDLRRRLARRFPRMAEAQPRGGWTGVYDVTPDGYPIVDQLGVDGLFVAVGFSGHGFKLSPEVGRLLAEYVATDLKPEDLRALRLERFAKGEPITPEAPFPAKRARRLP